MKFLKWCPRPNRFHFHFFGVAIFLTHVLLNYLFASRIFQCFTDRRSSTQSTLPPIHPYDRTHWSTCDVPDINSAVLHAQGASRFIFTFIHFMIRRNTSAAVHSAWLYNCVPRSHMPDVMAPKASNNIRQNPATSDGPPYFNSNWSVTPWDVINRHRDDCELRLPRLPAQGFNFHQPGILYIKRCVA
jgi:hypothetical protein